MSRLTQITIAKTAYPAVFSTGAAKEFTKHFGALEKVTDIFKSKDVTTILDQLVYMVSVLIQQGCIYKKIVDNEIVSFPTREELDVLIGLHDLDSITQEVMRCMGIGNSREVEVEPDQKNEQTTQEN